MYKHTNRITLLLGCFLCFGSMSAQLRILPNNYAVLIRKSLNNFPLWKAVADTLSSYHEGAPIITFDSTPTECLDTLSSLRPRYVAIVDAPDYMDKKYVVDLNVMSRKTDADPYKDFMWGIITGYSPATAMRMVKDGQKPFILRSLLSTISELRTGEWFEKMTCIEDQNFAFVSKKLSKNAETISTPIPYVLSSQSGSKYPDLLGTFHRAITEEDPDLIVTASHATEHNLEMPYSVGNIRAIRGMLYTDFPEGAKALINTSDPSHRRVYLPIGNCLIANMDKDPNSMAAAWLTSGGASAMIGYVVETWYGRAGWGGLKYFLSNAGRLALFESFFLNDLEIIEHNMELMPELMKTPYNTDWETFVALDSISKKIPDRKISTDMFGMYYDRDVLAYYGDPAWTINLQSIPKTSDYTILYEYKDNHLEITLKTHADFNPCNYQGNSWKSEHVADLPLAFYFPKRIDTPQLLGAKKIKSKYLLTEDALLIYTPDLKPNKTYRYKIVSR